MKANQLVLPGIIVSVLLLYLFTSLISSPRVAWASSSDSPQVTTLESEIPLNGLSANFPLSIRAWKTLIESAAVKYNLDPHLIAAVMLQESGGDANAYSASGAVGLMQVMPRDGIAAGFICNGNPCFHARPSMQELYDPAYNIEFGSKMLSGLFNTYGDWREALRAYGPMDVGYYYADIVLKIFENYR